MKKISIILVLACLILSCAKDGKDGAIGATGASGSDGNANVIGTVTVTTSAISWTPQGLYYYASFSVPSITQDVVNSGAVLCYAQNGLNWDALPFTFGTLTRTFQFGLGSCYIFYQNTDNTQTTNPAVKTFRVVVIPSNMRIKTIDYTNYSEVKGAHNLAD